MMKRIIACVLALCTVFCGSTGLSSGREEKAMAAHAEEIIWLSNGMNFRRRVRGGEELENELELISYTGTAADITVPLRIDGMTITAIGNGVFKNNTYIRSVELPDTINYFGTEVFYNSSVTSVNIPKNIWIIPDFTFTGCTALDDVTFHDNVSVVGQTAFQGTGISVSEELLHDDQYARILTSATELYVSENKWRFRIKTDEATGMPYAEVRDHADLKNYDLVIPSHYHSIPVTQLANKLYCHSIVIPDTFRSVTNFNNQKELKSVTFLGDRISFLGGFNKTGIEEISLPIIETMLGGAFSGCESLRKVTFSNTTDPLVISSNAFSDCTALEEVIIPKNCEFVNVKGYAFGNSGIKEIEFNGYSEIEKYAFNKCAGLTSVVFSGDSYISPYAFRLCPNLKNIVFGGKTEFDIDSFSDCDAVENITLDTSQRINGASFSGCKDLMNIGSEPAFDIETGDLRPDIKDFVLESFYNADDVGFLNQYIKVQAEKVADEYTDDSMSDMQKIKILHDWVCNNTQYNTENISALESHNDASVFLNEYAVCESYAKALNLLLNAAGIETYYVHSDDHAWNVVKLGGHYFHVDTTWDDGDKISYDWFLKSDSELKAAGGSHEEWELIAPTSMHSFQGDVLPQCEYRMGDLNTDGNIDSDDLALLQDYILGKAQISADDIVLADLDHDGVTDIFDLICMRRLISNTQ